MNKDSQNIPIKTIHLFPILDRLLIGLLKSLSPEKWDLPTIAKLWTVKDIASHLLDGNLRNLSLSRDHFFGEKVRENPSFQDLVVYLNSLNASWITATKRLSPQVLIELLEISGKQYYKHLAGLDPFAESIFPVSWAGQRRSENWFHIAREYTEKFIHQQQIREALGRQALFTKKLYYPFIDTFMTALPQTYRDITADKGTVITIKISSPVGGQWNIIKTEKEWQLIPSRKIAAESTVIIKPELAWKLFSKGITAADAAPGIILSGNKKLGKIALQMVSVMA
jgi:hypothetical protein